MKRPVHVPVLAGEALRLLGPRPGEAVLDCTIGLGGHAAPFAERIGPSGTLIGFDLDPANLAAARKRLAQEFPGLDLTLVHGSFVEAPEYLKERDLRADIVFADLGFSSNQMADPARGFSFREVGPLDMRLNPDNPTTAADLVNTLPERELADLIYHYGEDPFARRIASKLVRSRAASPIDTTSRLAQLVREAYGRRARASRIDPATRTFMALRIAVNDELGALAALLQSIEREAERLSRKGAEGGWISPGARIGIISFHSLEDRPVKQTFVSLEKKGFGKRLTKNPVTADEKEITQNPRARSARLRVFQSGS